MGIDTRSCQCGPLHDWTEAVPVVPSRHGLAESGAVGLGVKMMRILIGPSILAVALASSFLATPARASTERFHPSVWVQTPADEIVRQLRDIPTPLPAIARS